MTGDVTADDPRGAARGRRDGPGHVDALSRSDDDPQPRDVRWDADDRRRTGWPPRRHGLRRLPGVLHGRVTDDRFVDLEAAVDDVEEHRLARDKLEGIWSEDVVARDQVHLARRGRGPGHDATGRGRGGRRAASHRDRQPGHQPDEDPPEHGGSLSTCVRAVRLATRFAGLVAILLSVIPVYFATRLSGGVVGARG